VRGRGEGKKKKRDKIGAGTLGWKEAKASFLRFINIIDKTSLSYLLLFNNKKKK